MVQRVNISIPDGLGERLEKHKDKMNVSKICQEAIMTAVELQELKTIDLDEREKMILRLRKEKEQSEEQDYRLGQQEGINDAKNEMSYQTFRAVKKAHDFLQTIDGGRLNPTGVLPEWVYEEWLSESGHLNDDEEDVDKEIFVRGWIDGVVEIWDEISDEI